MKLSNRVVEKMRKQPASGGVFPETLKSKGKRQKSKFKSQKSKVETYYFPAFAVFNSLQELSIFAFCLLT
jgi:hypothetical protein